MHEPKPPARLELEVQWASQPIEGRVYGGDGRLERRFSGWLGLMAALEAAREADQLTVGAQEGSP